MSPFRIRFVQRGHSSSAACIVHRQPSSQRCSHAADMHAPALSDVPSWGPDKLLSSKTKRTEQPLTAGDGFVVVGAHDGQLRLYSERTLTRANTAIPGLGAPISSVDVTYDGKWIVATTKAYIMVVNCSFKVGSVGCGCLPLRFALAGHSWAARSAALAAHRVACTAVGSLCSCLCIAECQYVLCPPTSIHPGS